MDYVVLPFSSMIGRDFYKRKMLLLRLNMYKHFIMVLASLLLCSNALAQKSEWLSHFSPGLRSFLTIHPGDFQALTNILSEAFTNRYVRFYYFYTEDESVPIAGHFYPDTWNVFIVIKANQAPVDEFLEVIFESINSEGEQHFNELASEARAGTITKTTFALEAIKQEFLALKRTRDLLNKMTLTQKEISTSSEYTKIRGTPDRFEDFLLYLKSVDSSRKDLIKEYESKYDLMRNEEPSSQNRP